MLRFVKTRINKNDNPHSKISPLYLEYNSVSQTNISLYNSLHTLKRRIKYRSNLNNHQPPLHTRRRHVQHRSHTHHTHIHLLQSITNNHNQSTNNTLNNYHFTSFASKRDNSFSSSFFRFSSSSDTGKHSPHIHNGWSVIIAMNSFRLIPSLTSTFEFSARNRNALLLNNHNNNHFVTNSSGLAK